MGTEMITKISAVQPMQSVYKTGAKTDDTAELTGQQGRKFLEEQKQAEELKRKQQLEQHQKEKEQELDMLEKQLEASKKEAEGMEDMFEAFAKCIKIAARISKGDIVPMKDMKFLAEHEPDMYKQAILMRIPNPKPKKHKSLIKDEDEETNETESADSSSSGCEDIAPSEEAAAEDGGDTGADTPEK